MTTSTLDAAAILEALRPVQDPELRRSLVELNMIRDIRVEPERVAFTLVLTTPACPLAGVPRRGVQGCYPPPGSR
jgi:ATP-binding protein involved in chromosome partitioning